MAGALTALHLGALAVLWLSPPNILLRLAISVLILASWAYAHYRYVSQRGRRLTRAICRPDDSWEIEIDDRLRPAALRPSSFIHPRLIVLVFKQPGQRRSHAMILPPDCLDPALLRRLRVRLNTQRRQDKREAF